jgi:hypothetical protein
MCRTGRHGAERSSTKPAASNPGANLRRCVSKSALGLRKPVQFAQNVAIQQLETGLIIVGWLLLFFLLPQVMGRGVAGISPASA